MKKTYIILSIVITVLSASAQQDPMFTQYMFNPLSINPAYAGSSDNLYMSLLSRHQWIGFEGAPTTQTVSAHSPLMILNSAVGGTYLHDKIGPTSQNILYLDYAYNLQITENTKLSVGFRGGFSTHNLSLESASTTEVEINSTNSDPAMQIFPNAGCGLYVEKENWYIGLSIPRLLINKIDFGESDTQSNRIEKYYYFTAGYLFKVSENFKIKPTGLIKAVYGAPVSMDVTANFLFKERIWSGIFYRYDQSVGALCKYSINNVLQIGYSVDIALSPIVNYSGGTHELFVGYNFNFKKSVSSPRYF